MIAKEQIAVTGSSQILFLLICCLIRTVYSTCSENRYYWNDWWSYGGVSGPDNWDDHNREDWAICSTGKHQSPINIEPSILLFDPHLKPLKIEYTKVNGIFKNTGKDLTFVIKDSGFNYINITSGPLSYVYRLYQIKFHYGRHSHPGSEHRIAGRSFAGELHFMAYNSELYADGAEASRNPRGLAILAVFLTVSTEEHAAFNLFREKFVEIEIGDSCTDLNGLPVEQLLPDTDHYMTYSGSLTQPGCKETVTWILFNKPLHISHQQMHDLQNVPYQEWLKSNTRPIMPLYHRTVRTNISYKKRSRLCSMEIEKFYQVNPRLGQQ